MNKGLFFLAAMVFGLTIATRAQSVGINDDGSTPNNKAILDLNSSTKGFLPPRMATADITAITAPIPEGLNVYNTSLHCMVFYDGTVWRKFDGSFMTPPVIGQSYGGGIVFYVDGTGQHGLIAATSDQSSTATWGCMGTLIFGTSNSIGTGQANTTKIVTDCSDVGNAARICDELEFNGYSDWFLPSWGELIEMYQQRAVIGGFPDSPVFYWSSTEDSNNSARALFFYNGYGVYPNKSDNNYVRAIRAY